MSRHASFQNDILARGTYVGRYIGTVTKIHASNRTCQLEFYDPSTLTVKVIWIGDDSFATTLTFDKILESAFPNGNACQRVSFDIFIRNQLAVTVHKYAKYRISMARTAAQNETGSNISTIALQKRDQEVEDDMLVHDEEYWRSRQLPQRAYHRYDGPQHRGTYGGAYQSSWESPVEKEKRLRSEAKAHPYLRLLSAKDITELRRLEREEKDNE